MGRALFNEFLSDATPEGGELQRGLLFAGRRFPWVELLQKGKEMRSLVSPGRAYVVDPSIGPEGFEAFFAVATVPDTMLLWAKWSESFGPVRRLGRGLYELAVSPKPVLDRPLWGLQTSGSSANPKTPVGYADTLEFVALHYDRAVFQPTFGDSVRVGTLATCLPLQFSASFFMAVLPAILLCRDLLVFPPHDWRPLCAIAQQEHVICQSVPAVAASGCLSLGRAVDMSRAALLLGAGHITHERVRHIRTKLVDIQIANIYGTAETGAISLDRDPGHCTHVGHPIPGKPVWLRDVAENGVGTIATVGFDCHSYYWTPDRALSEVKAASTDYGHFDQEGRIYLDGRIDEGEKIRGLTIYPRVIERHILQLKSVSDVRVKILREAGGRECLVARVVGIDCEELVREHCRTLPAAAQPTHIECVAGDGAGAYSGNGKL